MHNNKDINNVILLDLSAEWKDRNGAIVLNKMEIKYDTTNPDEKNFSSLKSSFIRIYEIK